MTIVAFLIFALVVGLAASFAVWPVLSRRRDAKRARALLAGALGLFVAGVGAGVYLTTGAPTLALRTLDGARTKDLNGVIALIARHLRRQPDDLRGWTILGRAYFSADDSRDAAKAFARAIEVAQAQHKPTGDLYASYGETLVRQGAVGPEAEAAFDRALAEDPKSLSARYFLGFANAARGENTKAIALWQGVIDDSPPNAPYRQELVDRVAALTAASGATPDIAAMVEGLATRLKANPNDPAGWQKLVQAYAVLGNKAKAETALADARKALSGRKDAIEALNAQAASLGL
jgi:cytochrome c-type biogenesis protein CcmH